MCYKPYIRYQPYDSKKFIIRPLVPILDVLKKIGIKERNYEYYLKNQYPNHQIISCGQCLECKKRRSNEWTSRLLMEFESKNNCGMMLTLTYDDRCLNSYGDLNSNPLRGISLIKSDVQKFIKRLRKKISCPIKYYCCGEYGSKTNRPHYHIVILGYRFPDLRSSCVVKSHKGFPLFVSDTLSSLWKYGLSTVSNVTSSSLQYVSKYIQKREYGANAADKYQNIVLNHNVINHRHQVYNLSLLPIIDSIVPEFSLMSLKTAIGYEYMQSHYKDLLSKFKFCINKDLGTFVSLPRYFARFLEKKSEILFNCYKIKLCMYIYKINKYIIDYHYREKTSNEFFKYSFDYSPI